MNRIVILLAFGSSCVLGKATTTTTAIPSGPFGAETTTTAPDDTTTEEPSSEDTTTAQPYGTIVQYGTPGMGSVQTRRNTLHALQSQDSDLGNALNQLALHGGGFWYNDKGVRKYFDFSQWMQTGHGSEFSTDARATYSPLP